MYKLQQMDPQKQMLPIQNTTSPKPHMDLLNLQPPTTSVIANKNQNKTQIKILQININGLHKKHSEIQSFLSKHNIDIALIQEAHSPANTPTAPFYGYDSIYTNKQPTNHTLLTLIKNNIMYHNPTTDITNLRRDPALNLQSFK